MWFFNFFRAKHVTAPKAQKSYAHKKRKWAFSARRKEINAEMRLPPRPLTSKEHGLIRWLLIHGKEEATSYLPQMEDLKATRSCDCGCPTISLQVAESCPLGDIHGTTLLSDYYGRTERGELVGITLYQEGGKLSSLDAYVLGDILGDSLEFGFPVVNTLQSWQETAT